MYVRCDKCGWSQDDFYDKSYNPAEHLKNWDDILFGDETNKLDRVFPEKVDGEVVTYKQVIARDFENFGKRIREMKWTTIEDYQNDPNPTCPKCGGTHLIED